MAKNTGIPYVMLDIPADIARKLERLEAENEKMRRTLALDPPQHAMAKMVMEKLGELIRQNNLSYYEQSQIHWTEKVSWFDIQHAYFNYMQYEPKEEPTPPGE